MKANPVNQTTAFSFLKTEVHEIMPELTVKIIKGNKYLYIRDEVKVNSKSLSLKIYIGKAESVTGQPTWMHSPERMRGIMRRSLRRSMHLPGTAWSYHRRDPAEIFQWR